MRSDSWPIHARMHATHRLGHFQERDHRAAVVYCGALDQRRNPFEPCRAVATILSLVLTAEKTRQQIRQRSCSARYDAKGTGCVCSEHRHNNRRGVRS